MNDFDLQRLKSSPDYEKVSELLELLLEARDALPYIKLHTARLAGISLTLADRIDESLKPWLKGQEDE